MSVLEVEDLVAGYGGGVVLHGVGFTVEAGSVHALLGHNGAGKTTFVHAVAGLLRVGSGRISVDGKDVTRWPAHRVARAGVGLVPQGRRVFAGLTVAEHLAVAQRRNSTTAWTVTRVLKLLPRLGELADRRGGRLSGGEQQMLAIARALLGGSRLLLFDEPTEGLAPAVAASIGDLIEVLASEGAAVLLTGPTPRQAVSLADRISILTAGRITAFFDGETARKDPEPLSAALAAHPLAASG